VLIVSSDKNKILKEKGDMIVNICMFFTVLVLHFATVYTIRNGMQMSKFALFHSEEFTNPKAAFALGLLITIINLSCEVANMLTTLS